jgi:2-polyprenyl-3-methyl-5-hydroxy-6-metoxy-1,4-benzoquinol methylase
MTSDDVPNLDEVWSDLTGYQRTAALKAAIELDVFTAIGAGRETAAALAARCGAAERGMRILCDHLLGRGFLVRDGDRYALSATGAAFLDRGSPGCIASAISFVTAPTIVAGFDHLTEAVRRGGTAVPVEQAVLAPDHEVWIEFARAMAPIARLTAMLVASVLATEGGPSRRVLDVAAGHGQFGIAVASQDLEAELVALDWPNVLAVAQENAAGAGLGARFRTLPGSAFEVEWGTGYDLVLLPNFLHHFDAAGGAEVLSRARAALAPGGRVAIVEFVPADDRRSPAVALSFGVTMLAGTPAGDVYTFAELRELLAKAGFTGGATLHDLAPSPQQLVVARA